MTELRPKTHHRRGKKDGEGHRKREKIRGARLVPESFALLDLRDKIVGARMQSACGEGLGCSGRRNSYLPKEKARKKKAQDFILFWKGQNRPNPESRDERPPGNHPGKEGK